MPACWLSDPATYSGADPAEQLTKALLLHDEQRNQALDKYTQEHPTRRYGAGSDGANGVHDGGEVAG